MESSKFVKLNKSKLMPLDRPRVGFDPWYVPRDTMDGYTEMFYRFGAVVTSVTRGQYDGETGAILLTLDGGRLAWGYVISNFGTCELCDAWESARIEGDQAMRDLQDQLWGQVHWFPRGATDLIERLREGVDYPAPNLKSVYAALLGWMYYHYESLFGAIHKGIVYVPRSIGYEQWHLEKG